MRIRTWLALVAAAAALVVSILLVRPAPADEPEEEQEAQAVFKNVKVLTHVTSKAEMRRIMKEQAAALGVKCTHCHVPGKFDLDDKKEKKTARAMLKMVAEINRTYFPDAKEPPVRCWTCHRGEEEPADPPPLPPPSTDSFEAEE